MRKSCVKLLFNTVFINLQQPPRTLNCVMNTIQNSNPSNRASQTNHILITIIILLVSQKPKNTKEHLDIYHKQITYT